MFINRAICNIVLTTILSVAFLMPVWSKEKPMIYVSFWFDTEDYILPEADDAAKRIAEIFTERNVKATFKIVGEKAKLLEERGRNDVILAMAQHDIAYHTTNHSIHPTPSEYSRDLGWHEGVQEFIAREGIGLDMLKDVFNVGASCYGQPGGSWTPQSYAALREWNIPLYLDVTSHVNLDNRPFWYGGVLNVLELGNCVVRTNGWDEEAVKQACSDFDQAVERLQKEGGGIISVFYHPCEFVHKAFWDGVNFSRGKNTPRPEWKLPPKQSPEEQEQAYGALTVLLDYVIKQPNVTVVTAREVASLYPDLAYTRPFNRSDVLHIAKKLSHSITYIDLENKTLSAAEGLVVLCSVITQTDDNFKPEDIELVLAYGPASRPDRFIENGSFRWEEIVESCELLLETVYEHEQLPSVVWVGDKPLRPEDFAATIAGLFPQIIEKGIPASSIPFVKGEMEAQKYVADDDDHGLWGWVIFPEDFHAPSMMEIAKLQAWTIKPAILRK